MDNQDNRLHHGALGEETDQQHHQSDYVKGLMEGREQFKSKLVMCEYCVFLLGFVLGVITAILIA